MEYNPGMPRVAATADVFNAIAEPRRRQIIEILRSRKHAVGELVDQLRIPQPAVSKHLGVLRRVGLVSVEKQGQQRFYHLEGESLKAVHDWVKMYERYWSHQLDRIKARAELKARQRSSATTPAPKDPEK